MLLTLVGVVAGSLAWVARDRTARQADIEREVNGLLDQATLFRDQGRWAEARSVLERAERLVKQAESGEQQQHVRQFTTDLNLAEQLEELALWFIMGTAKGRDWLEARQAYATAFRDYGIDLAALEPATAAERIRASAIREQLLAALDDWDWQYAIVKLDVTLQGISLSLLPPARAAKMKEARAMRKPGANDVPHERLRIVANLADSDEWRKRIRPLPEGTGGQRNRQQLEELAGSPEAAALSPATALLLARGLYKNLAIDKSRQVLYAAHQRTPGNLRLNYELAWLFWYSRDPMQREKGAGFTRSALARRPQSPGLHFMLGEFLLKSEDFEQAVTEFRKVTELNPDHDIAHFKLGVALAGKRAGNDAIREGDRA